MVNPSKPRARKGSSPRSADGAVRPKRKPKGAKGSKKGTVKKAPVKKAARKKAAPKRVASKAVKSKTVKSKTVKSKTVKSKTVKSKAVKSKAVKSKAVKPKATKSKKVTSKQVTRKTVASRTVRSNTLNSKRPRSRAGKSRAASPEEQARVANPSAAPDATPDAPPDAPAATPSTPVPPAERSEPTRNHNPSRPAPKRRKPKAATGPATPDAGTGKPSEGVAPPAPTIPPLPEEEDDFVPFEEEERRQPVRDVPGGAPPREILAGVRRGELHVSALNHLSDEEVVVLARSMGHRVPPEERRSTTLYRLLQETPASAEKETSYVEGLLELHPDGYGFLRRPERSYVQHPDDVYVSAGIVRKVGLRAGHWVSGTARRSRPGERMLALHEVEEVNHEDVSALKDLVTFDNLTVVFPDQRFLLEVAPEDYEMRVMDIFCPIGRGQRALIVSPPRAGKTIILQKLADAIAHNSPNVDIVVLLVDERPEEVTNMRRSVRGEVVASTFDRPSANHVRVAELVMEKVKRMVEFGRHVVILLDSITRLGRAYNNMAGPSGRILTGGLEAKALTKPKRFFGAARNIEDGGSLTIVATALVDTGSRMDDVIFEEFKGSGNMEVVLDRELANARIWPAINLPASATRNEDLLLHPEELRRVNLMRRAMAGRDPQSVMEGMREQLSQYRTNAELLMSVD